MIHGRIAGPYSCNHEYESLLIIGRVALKFKIVTFMEFLSLTCTMNMSSCSSMNIIRQLSNPLQQCSSPTRQHCISAHFLLSSKFASLSNSCMAIQIVEQEIQLLSNAYLEERSQTPLSGWWGCGWLEQLEVCTVSFPCYKQEQIQSIIIIAVSSPQETLRRCFIVNETSLPQLQVASALYNSFI